VDLDTTQTAERKTTPVIYLPAEFDDLPDDPRVIVEEVVMGYLPQSLRIE
jgi:hypothetical protein